MGSLRLAMLEEGGASSYVDHLLRRPCGSQRHFVECAVHLPPFKLQEPRQRSEGLPLAGYGRDRWNLARLRVLQQRERQMSIQPAVQESVAVVTEAICTRALTPAIRKELGGLLKNHLEFLACLSGVACAAGGCVVQEQLGVPDLVREGRQQSEPR